MKIDWDSMTGSELWETLKNAPRAVAGPWRKDDQGWTRDDMVEHGVATVGSVYPDHPRYHPFDLTGCLCGATSEDAITHAREPGCWSGDRCLACNLTKWYFTRDEAMIAVDNELVRTGWRLAGCLPPPEALPEHGRSGVVTSHKPHCYCGQIGVRSERYDAYYCRVGLVWLEATCGSATCNFCEDRPEKPDVP